jgi:hypothetical protein
MILRGPADADHYRVKVGRYGDRWYVDPLPADDVWSACDDQFPSVSTVKKASGNDWSFVSIKRIGDAGGERLRSIADLPDGERHDALRSLDRRGLEQAAQRGTNVHNYIEARLRGLPPMLLTDGMPGAQYVGAVEEFLDTHQPELYAAEYVVINRSLNGHGYGGTPDADLRIGGELLKVDWKTRGPESAHGAYPEEAAQLAAGSFGDYMIVLDDDGIPVRRPMPDLAGGIIVSIKPDGCRIYPVDLDKARAHWESLHAWWVARRDERVAIGKPWAPGKASAKAERPDPHHHAKTLHRDTATVTVTTPPDEGAEASEEQVAPLRERYKAVNASWVNALRSDAVTAHCDFHLSGAKTLRRLRITDGLVMLTEHDACDNDLVKALVRHVVGDDMLSWPTVTAGAAVGSLSAVDAAAFVGACESFIAGRFTLEMTLDGPHLAVAA